MEESELISIRELLKVKVYDDGGLHIGHVQDLALEKELYRPRVAYLGVHLLWSDRVGAVELVRGVEDIVLLLPWSQVKKFEPDCFLLRGVHPDFPVETARGKWLIRRDILDKQMLDPEGDRLQRVDDVFLKGVEDTFEIVGLGVSMGRRIAGPKLRRYIRELRKKEPIEHDVDLVPWKAVQRIDDEAMIIGGGFERK